MQGSFPFTIAFFSRELRVPIIWTRKTTMRPTTTALSLSLLSLFLGKQLSAQGPSVPGEPSLKSPIQSQGAFHFEGKPLPGKAPGSQRWIVHFKSRSFDLSALNAEYAGARNPDRVEALAKELNHKAHLDQADFVEKVEALGAKVTDQFWLVNAAVVEIQPSQLAKLRGLKRVAYLQPDVKTVPLIKTATNSKNHDSDAIQAKGFTGLGVACAIIDTGQDENMNGTGKPHITYSKRGSTTTRLVLNRKMGSMPPDDVHGHGTGVASIAAGWKWRTSTADQGHAFDANICGYSIANSTSGGSSTSNMARSYQQIVIDTARYKIMASNLSYTGSPNPLSIEQKAADQAALTADLLVCTAAGNSGSSTSRSQLNLNGLSVGAVKENSHNLATFSSRGMINGKMKFPDICANGVSTNMARRNNETSDYIGSGTSMASPQVCGSATLLRGRFKTLRSYEAKAILLAAAQANAGTSSTQVSTGPGVGYLYNPTAHAIAGGSLRHGLASVSSSVRIFRRNLPVVRGRKYQIAIAWNRLNVNVSTFSNLDLTIRNGNSTVISSANKISTLEFVRFTAPTTGVYVIEVQGTSLSAQKQPFAWASTSDTARNNSIPGTYTLFGTGCLGTGTSTAPVGQIVPAAYRTLMGNTANYYPFGRAKMRYQQVFSNSELRNASMTGVSLRQDDRVTGRAGGSIPLELLLGYTTKTPGTLTTSFAGNFNSGTPARLFNGILKLPTLSGTNKDPQKFAVNIKFTRPFIYAQTRSRSLLIELKNSSSTNSFYSLDAAFGSTATTSRLYAFSPTATTGSITRNYGLVMRFDNPPPKGAVPQLSNTGAPEINRSFKLHLSQARKSSVGVLLFGLSKTRWGSVPLPLDLGFVGAKGCNLYVSFDLILGAVSTGLSGGGTLVLPTPNDRALLGKVFHNQWFVLDRPANGLGLVFTNAGTGKIGG